MRSWIPVPGTTSGRLVEAALDLFGAQGFADVGVSALAERAGVTTGSLYHHFGSKAGLYRLVRADVEQRVVDRLEGAAATRRVESVAELAPILLVGFDYLVSSGFARLLAEPSPEPTGEPGLDHVEQLLARLLPGADDPAALVAAALVAAAWRTALRHASAGEEAAGEARGALHRVLTGA